MTNAGSGSPVPLLLDGPQIRFENLRRGIRCESPGRTVTEADIVAFAGLSGDYNQLHTDRKFAAESVHGERIAHGLLVLSLLSGLSTRTVLMQGLADEIVGLAGLECRFKRPTRIGDTIRVVLTVSDLRITSKPGRAIVVLERNALNQHDEVVLETEWSLMVRCTVAGTPA